MVALTLVFVGCGLTIRALLAFVIRCADYVHRDSRLKAGLALAGTLLLLARLDGLRAPGAGLDGGA